MPVHMGEDPMGKFFQWGDSGKKYYFTNSAQARRAKQKAIIQGYAIMSHGYKEGKKEHKGGRELLPNEHIFSNQLGKEEQLRENIRQIMYDIKHPDPHGDDITGIIMENWDGTTRHPDWYNKKVYELLKKKGDYIPPDLAYWYANYNTPHFRRIEEQIADLSKKLGMYWMDY